MSIQYCEFCDKGIDTDFDIHFHESEKGMCEAEEESLQFPIYCKDSGYFYKIDSPEKCLTVSTIECHEEISSVDQVEIMAYPYRDFIAGEYEDSTPMEFFKAFTETNNLLIRRSR